MARTIKEIELVSVHKILSWTAGIVATLLVAALTASVANLYTRIADTEKQINNLLIHRAAADVTGTAVIERLVKIESKLDTIQSEVLLQRKK